jgi:hypothetical protein
MSSRTGYEHCWEYSKQNPPAPRWKAISSRSCIQNLCWTGHHTKQKGPVADNDADSPSLISTVSTQADHPFNSHMSLHVICWLMAA